LQIIKRKGIFFWNNRRFCRYSNHSKHYCFSHILEYKTKYEKAKAKFLEKYQQLAATTPTAAPAVTSTTPTPSPQTTLVCY
jgi:hypothetical protein